MRPRLKKIVVVLAFWPAAALSLLAQPAPTAAAPPPDQPSQIDPNFSDDDDYPVQPVQGVRASANLSYTEKIGEDPPPIKGSDGFTGVLNKEAKQIEQVGMGKHNAGAELSVSVMPRLQRGKTPAEKSIVTLEAKEDSWKIDPDLPGSSQAQLETERGYVISKLSSWQTTLTPEQLNTLDQGGSVDLKVTSPFSALGMLSHPQLVVSFSQASKPKIVSVTVHSLKSSDALTVGRMAVAEVSYDRPVKLPMRTVHLDAGAGALEIKAKNTGNDTVFVTEPFLLQPENPDEKPDGQPDSFTTPGSTRSRG